MIDFRKDVLPCCGITAAPDQQSFGPVWDQLPQGVCWLEACVEASDLERFYVVGSPDWKEAFGSFRLTKIATFGADAQDDPSHHHSRIVKLGRAYLTGQRLPPVVAIAYSGEGPFVILDGNHRAVAMQRHQLFSGQQIRLGLHASMGTAYVWFRHLAHLE